MSHCDSIKHGVSIVIWDRSKASGKEEQSRQPRGMASARRHVSRAWHSEKREIGRKKGGIKALKIKHGRH